MFNISAQIVKVYIKDSWPFTVTVLSCISLQVFLDYWLAGCEIGRRFLQCLR